MTENLEEQLKHALEINPNDVNLLDSLAAIFLEQNKLGQARKMCERAIEINPNLASIYNRLGFILKRQGENASAIYCYEQAIRIDPKFYNAYCNLAKTHYEQNNLSKAKEIYLKVLQLIPHNIMAQFGLAMVFHEQHELEQAKSIYKKIIDSNPYYSDAYLQLAHLYDAQGSFSEAIVAFQKLIELHYNLPETYASLAAVYQKNGDLAKSTGYYQQALALGNTKAAYQLSILANEDVNQLPLQDIAKAFDTYAEHYDDALVSVLKSSIPELLFNAFLSIYSSNELLKSVIDIGCGTGLGGEIFKKISNHLIGIDVSEKMLEQARKKNIYQELYISDILSYLNKSTTKYDLIIAADVIVYFGDLETIFNAVSHAIVSSGYFVFSTEHTEQAPYYLNVSGRYMHSITYIQQLAQKYKFTIKYCQNTNLRKEYGSWVKGNIYVLHNS